MCPKKSHLWSFENKCVWPHGKATESESLGGRPGCLCLIKGPRGFWGAAGAEAPEGLGPNIAGNKALTRGPKPWGPWGRRPVGRQHLCEIQEEGISVQVTSVISKQRFHLFKRKTIFSHLVITLPCKQFIC